MKANGQVMPVATLATPTTRLGYFSDESWLPTSKTKNGRIDSWMLARLMRLIYMSCSEAIRAGLIGMATMVLTTARYQVPLKDLRSTVVTRM